MLTPYTTPLERSCWGLLLLAFSCAGCGKTRERSDALATSPSGASGSSSVMAPAPTASSPSPAPGPSSQLSRAVRIIPFPSGSARVTREDEVDHVVVDSTNVRLRSESFCPLESGRYDELAAFFQRLQDAVASGDAARVSALVRFPLTVNGIPAGTIAVDVVNR